jgi:hypothetical protein
MGRLSRKEQREMSARIDTKLAEQRSDLPGMCLAAGCSGREVADGLCAACIDPPKRAR